MNSNEKLTESQFLFLARLVEEGPLPVVESDGDYKALLKYGFATFVVCGKLSGCIGATAEGWYAYYNYSVKSNLSHF